jgi:hypothetical protein
MPRLRPRVIGGDNEYRRKFNIAAKRGQTTLGNIIAWIPIEVIAAYKAIVGQIPITEIYTHLGFSIGFIAITILWILFATRRKNDSVPWRQACVAGAAFMFWSAGTEDQVIMHGIFSWWQSWMGLVSMALGTVALPILDGLLQALGVPQD